MDQWVQYNYAIAYFDAKYALYMLGQEGLRTTTTLAVSEV